MIFQVPNPTKNGKSWDITSCCSRKPERACAINSVWNIAMDHQLRRFNFGNLTLYV